MPVTASEAVKLAYYKSEMSPGVLAPRGWFCFGTYGSAGASLFITPGPIDESKVFSAEKLFTGPVVELDYRNGGTSGRNTVAEIIARVFPAYKDFVEKVRAISGVGPEFTYGPYPNDKLTYRSDRVVEFVTPPNTNGLGTTSRVRPNTESIRGVAILLGDTPDLLLLSLRLPPASKGLEPAVIATLEGETGR